MPLPNSTCSDLHSTAMPGELGRVRALGTQNCKEVTVPPNSSVTLPAGSTYALCSGGGEEPHQIMLYPKMNESSLSPLQRDFLRSQKNENWFFPPWSIYLQTSFLSRKIMKAFQLQCLCLTCSEKESKFSNQRGSGLHGCTCTSSMQKMHIFLYHPSSCCNSHTHLEILRSAFHATRWNRI